MCQQPARKRSVELMGVVVGVQTPWRDWLVLMSGHQCRCGGDGGVVWSIAKEGETKFYWEEDNTLTVTQFLSTILHPVSDVIHYTLELDTPTAVMGQAQCGSVRMAFSKLLKLRSSCCKT